VTVTSFSQAVSTHIVFGIVFFQVLATSGCNSINCVNQPESRFQILQFDWMAWFSILQPDVARTWKIAVQQYHAATSDNA